MKKFLLSITLMLAAIVGVQAQRVSLDFTTNDSWGFPVGSSNKTAEAATFTSGDYSIELTGSSGDGYYFNSDGYLMLGKSGATLTLPAFDFNVSKIEVVGRTGASANTLENVYVGSTAVSTQCKGSAATNTFEIAAEHQAAGTVYTIKIESKHNAQFTQINIYSADEPVAPSVSVPVASVAAGVYTTAQSVTFESEYANAENPTISYYYTTDGNEPTKESTLLEGALEVTESCTVKVIAVMTVGEEEYTSKVASYEYIISEAAKFVAVTATEQVVAGKVLLVANNLAAHGISGNYGYLPVHNVTAVEGGIENAVYYGAFELEVAEGGWYIKDNNGKYIYMTGTYNSFNVSEEIPAEGAVWTIAITEDGTATITNVAMSKYVQYSTKHTSYGAYAEAQDGGVVPTLYVPYVEPAPEPEVTANAISLAFTRTGTNGESVSVVAVNENGETLENVSVAVATTVDFRPTAGSITEAILCPNVNGNTGADIEMTFTLSNLPEGFSFNNIGLDIHALNGGNRYQENGDNKVRQWNVAVAANDAAFGSLTDIDIAAGIGESGVSVHKVWDIEGAAVESAENSIVIKVNVTSGTKNEGCFFGLSEIQLTTVEVVEPEAPFEVVAVTPSEAVAELSTITVEFSEEIAGEQDLMAMETIYVGSRTNACNFTVDGKVLTITLWTPITAPGEYALKVPASVGITRASNGEAVVIDGEITFTVEAPAAPFEVVAVTPSEAVTELSTITVEFSEEIAGEQDLMAMETIYVGSRTNACNFTVDGK
ncbi:MAG: chitobiase/beta-hexosaminidase C-terminal domain-containing protein, partial [Bacteroidaceae bacterium]|nr:chitobiase/beta-hexosaminidase C-terminal domain-containing protein [Bacteroidaceae bacterium]